MSASDAVPLPRLGEVFFDVRGSARSMRLSWYADTGVAVFSIWQAGTCTGTFRLPMADLDRMIETLRSGPDGLGPPAQAADFGDSEPGGRQWDDYRPAGQAGEGHGGAGYHGDDYGPGGYGADEYGDGDYQQAGYPGDRLYPASPPGPAYPPAGGPADFAGQPAQAHYPPDAPWSGYDPETGATAAVSGSGNSAAVPYPGGHVRPPESFPYGPPEGYEAIAGQRGGPDLPLR
ncbi:MAG TPA: hypothetical protein VH637_26045 [Streptosporangiaceae bacterium]